MATFPINLSPPYRKVTAYGLNVVAFFLLFLFAFLNLPEVTSTPAPLPSSFSRRLQAELRLSSYHFYSFYAVVFFTAYRIHCLFYFLTCVFTVTVCVTTFFNPFISPFFPPPEFS